MIYSVDVSAGEVVVGQTFSIEVHADSSLQVSISCFVDNPPPPRFKGCHECNVQVIQSGQRISVTPRKDTWLNTEGGYRIKVTDVDGNTETATVRVLGDTASAGGATMSM
ncbi:hypothetical protein RCH14_002780 [Massilia sp. MP_M2]|uniref:hypothetical protein n=1 Tax=Massilia sp. MP_M2 TaxID=3071713 RepID=UPI00319DBF07